MDLEKILILIITFLGTFVSTKLWDFWRESKKTKTDEKKLLNVLLYQLISLSDSIEILGRQIKEHSQSITFITTYVSFYIKNIDNIYAQIESLLQEIAKNDAITAAGIRNVQFNDVSNRLFILKMAIEDITKKATNKEMSSQLLNTNIPSINQTLEMMLEISKITMYITSSKIDKDTLNQISTSYPDKRLQKEFGLKKQ